MKTNFVITARLNDRVADSVEMAKAADRAIKAFCRGDWGLVPDEDKAYNNADLKARQGHVLGRYDSPEGDLYINLEFDPEEKQDTACIMFADEW